MSPITWQSIRRTARRLRESGGKKYPGKNAKIGNAYLKWAFSEAAVLFLRGNEYIAKKHNRRVSKYGKARALSILARDLGTAVYFMLRRREPFDMIKFLGAGNASPKPNWTEQGKTIKEAAQTKCIVECPSVAMRQDTRVPVI